MKFIVTFFYSLFFVSLSLVSFAQSPDTLFKATVQEVMSLTVEARETEIISASKKAEKLFETPVSASVITREQIERAGCLSIPEALRLSQGLIVRETTSGNYDVHIQGMDNIKPFKSQFALVESTSILVMIDGRPVYNYFQGGTFWETLPIDIADLEAIEIVRGASSALYGSNAVVGVINLITSESSKTGTKGRASIQYSNKGSNALQAHISTRLNRNWSAGFSANQQYRKRLFNEYYRFSINGYAPLDSLRFIGTGTTTNKYRYPDRDLGVERRATNFWTDYKLNDKISMKLRGGWQNSTVQKMYVDNRVTPLTTNTSNSSYIEYNAQVYGLSLQASYNQGVQKTVGVTGWQYKFSTVFTNLEYARNIKGIDLRAGFSYQSADYSDKPAADEFGISRAFLGASSHNLNSLAFFLRSEYSWKGFKAVAAVRAEKYNKPDKTYLPYQLALTYQLGKSWLFRITNSKANQGAFILESFYKHTPAPGRFLIGNENLNLVNANYTSAGIRKKINNVWEIEAEVFTQTLSDLAGFDNSETNGTSYIVNYAIKAQQRGVNASVELQANKNIQFRIFASLQETFLDNFPTKTDYSATARIANKNTPQICGGMYINWQPTTKLNFNLNVYHLSDQMVSSFIPAPVTTGVKDLGTPAFAVFNVNTTYSFRNNFKVFVNLRNFSWGSRKQTFQVDDILPEGLLGVRLDL